MVLEAVYEQGFLPCSYGFRPGRSAHQALSQLAGAISVRRQRWVLEVDVCKTTGPALEPCVRIPGRATHAAPALYRPLLPEGRGLPSDPIERTYRLADTVGMAKEPEPSKPTSWDVYKIAKKAMWLGTVEAPDKGAAVEKAAQEFKTEVWRLYAVSRR
jgi:hypothetical protein